MTRSIPLTAPAFLMIWAAPAVAGACGAAGWLSVEAAVALAGAGFYGSVAMAWRLAPTPSA